MLAKGAMATLTIRNVPAKLVRSLKALAHRTRRSMEQEVRAVLEQHVGEREALVDEIERSSRITCSAQSRSWTKCGGSGALSMKPGCPSIGKRTRQRGYFHMSDERLK
jgi:plasmid stability protein